MQINKTRIRTKTIFRDHHCNQFKGKGFIVLLLSIQPNLLARPWKQNVRTNKIKPKCKVK